MRNTAKNIAKSRSLSYRMKDGFLLIMAGVVCAFLAWCYFWYFQDWALPILYIEFAIGAVAGVIRRERKKTSIDNSAQAYSSYDQVPFYGKQWFFWTMYFTLFPVAIALLLSNGIYQQKQGEVKPIGGAAEALAFGILAAFFWYRLYQILSGCAA